MIFSRQALTNHLLINHFNLPNGKHVAFHDFSHFSIIFPRIFLYFSHEFRSKKPVPNVPGPGCLDLSLHLAALPEHGGILLFLFDLGLHLETKQRRRRCLVKIKVKHWTMYVYVWIYRIYLSLFIQLFCNTYNIYIYIQPHAKVYVMYIGLYICIKQIKTTCSQDLLDQVLATYMCLKQVQTRHVCNEHSRIRMEWIQDKTPTTAQSWI